MIYAIWCYIEHYSGTRLYCTEWGELSWCQLCHHWWQWRLSWWQPQVPPMMATFASWQSSFCQLCHHWWHWRLSWWQPPVPPMMTTLASWQFSFCQLCHHWWHWRLSRWQPPVPPLMTKLASWQLCFQCSISHELCAWFGYALFVVVVFLIIYGLMLICLYSSGLVFQHWSNPTSDIGPDHFH